MSAILGIFTGPYAMLAKWAVIALVVASFGGWCWFKGNAHGTQKLYDYQAAQAKEGARIVVKQGKVTERVVTRYIKVRGTTDTVTRTVEKEVVRYAENNPGLALDYRWRWLHDTAAANALPGPGPRLDAEGGAPTAAQALEAVTANYAKHHACVDRLDGLQEWVREQRKVR